MLTRLSDVDPSRTLGLHELRDSLGFQLSYAEEHTKDILSNLGYLVENTRRKAAKRAKSFCLDRRTKTMPRIPESMWERAMFNKWELGMNKAEYLPFCKSFVTYQFPLYAHQEKGAWGSVDLLGIGNDHLPVPNELKRQGASAEESPLRLLVELAAYGFAILEDWPNFKEAWWQHVEGFGASRPKFQFSLARLCLVGVAPGEYWRSRTGLPGADSCAFPQEAWEPLNELVNALGKWFDIHFAEVLGAWVDDRTLPVIDGAQEIQLPRPKALPSDASER